MHDTCNERIDDKTIKKLWQHSPVPAQGELPLGTYHHQAERSHALIVLRNPLTTTYRTRIADFATKSRLPAMYGDREFVDAGGLMSYDSSVTDNYRRVAVYVYKILQGAKPAELAVAQPTKFELIINLKTARALAFTIPQSILLRADEVIE